MAANTVPTAWIANWSANADTITIPIASFTELTANEANATTGDIRKIMYAVNEQLWTAWSALAAANRTTKMTMTKSSSSNATTSVLTHVYTWTFNNTVTTQDVANET